MKRPYLLHKRGKVWHYRLADERTFHTTGQTRRGDAEAFVLRILRQRRSVRLHPQLTFDLRLHPKTRYMKPLRASMHM